MAAVAVVAVVAAITYLIIRTAVSGTTNSVRADKPMVEPQLTWRSAAPAMSAIPNDASAVGMPPAVFLLFPVGNVSVFQLSWGTIAGATSYRVWLDGIPLGAVNPVVGTTQGTLVPVVCGIKHRINVQGKNAGGYGPLVKPPVYFTPDVC